MNYKNTPYVTSTTVQRMAGNTNSGRDGRTHGPTQDKRALYLQRRYFDS